MTLPKAAGSVFERTNTGLAAKVAVDARVIGNEKLADGVYRLMVEAPSVALRATPGQFAQIRILGGGVLLRRPLGLASVDLLTGQVSFIYRVVGKGTGLLSALKVGDIVNVLGPLGHGFSREVKAPLLVGGGMGLSPLLYYASYLAARNIPAEILMGGRTAGELFWKELFSSCASKIHITTDDGSIGTKGFVTTLLPELLKDGAFDHVAVCGPPIMMKGVAELTLLRGLPCEVSLEARMGCGLGACLSCSIDTLHGRKKICKDGPVFPAEEVFI